MTLSVERAARNQTLFREVNERIAELAGELDENDESPFQPFICECSHDDCAESVEATLAEYEAIRANGARFLLAPGHELPVSSMCSAATVDSSSSRRLARPPLSRSNTTPAARERPGQTAAAHQPAAIAAKPKLLFYSATSGECRRAEGFLAQVLQRRQNHETFAVHHIHRPNDPTWPSSSA